MSSGQGVRVVGFSVISFVILCTMFGCLTQWNLTRAGVAMVIFTATLFIFTLAGLIFVEGGISHKIAAGTGALVLVLALLAGMFQDFKAPDHKKMIFAEIAAARKYYTSRSAVDGDCLLISRDTAVRAMQVGQMCRVEVDIANNTVTAIPTGALGTAGLHSDTTFDRRTLVITFASGVNGWLELYLYNPYTPAQQWLMPQGLSGGVGNQSVTVSTRYTFTS